jgi:Family of unknown function (DUF6228)
VVDDEGLFVVAPAGCSQRWVVDQPLDPYGDGYVHHMLVEVSDDGISATSTATLEGQGAENLVDFLVGLARDWQGWTGTRQWASMEGQLTLDASHDRTGHVQVAVTLRRGRRTYDPDAWSARVILTIEAGEQLRQLAQNADSLLHP